MSRRQVETAVVGAGTILNAAVSSRRWPGPIALHRQPRLQRLGVRRGPRQRRAPAARRDHAGEIMTAAEHGLDFLKFFPAEQAGGTAFLKALASPFAGIRFCPTGGVTADNAREYLALPNVTCVGGSGGADLLVKAGAWTTIEALAREASGLSA